ncbi:unnamed protein product [Clonostachys byssicola]|uniref:Uncharacterized protein n=1 Tax=Clonostachys byssicola TaxID=160290 RepID=A0A9N9Y3D3_9HYPO|nr:unnamed protein product [Clonostachys byssicola]
MTLKNLCQVSKTLRFVAEPVLYHYWKGTFAPDTLGTDKLGADMFAVSSIGFISRLHARPHLWRYVRALNIRDSARDEYSYGPSFPFGDNLEYENNPIITGKAVSRVKRIAASAGIKCSSSDFSAQNFAESIAQIMLAMAPRLNELTLIAARSWDFRLFVSKLELDLAPRRCICMDCSHYDADIDDAWFERRAERLLVGATASHLKSLICTSGCLKEDFDMPQLDSLRVDIRHSWPNEEAFLNNMKCLRRLAFQSSCPESFRFPLKSSTTIEELSIGFGREARQLDAFDGLQFDEAIFFCIPHLKYFTNLKWLSVHVEAICWFEDDLDDETKAEDEIEIFISLLPDSLEILHIDMTDERGDPETIFESILVALSARKLKKLKAILWSPEEIAWLDGNFRIVRPETNPDGQPGWSIVTKESQKKLGRSENAFFPNWERVLAK